MNAIKFSDKNECEDGSICGVNEVCVNVPGSYECQCQDGFSKVEGICTDDDACYAQVDQGQKKIIIDHDFLENGNISKETKNATPLRAGESIDVNLSQGWC